MPDNAQLAAPIIGIIIGPFLEVSRGEKLREVQGGYVAAIADPADVGAVLAAAVGGRQGEITGLAALGSYILCLEAHRSLEVTDKRQPLHDRGQSSG